MVEEQILPGALAHLQKVLAESTYANKEELKSISQFIEQGRVVAGKKSYRECRSENRKKKEVLNLKATKAKVEIVDERGHRRKETAEVVQICLGFYQKYQHIFSDEEERVAEAIDSAAKDILNDIAHHYGYRSYPAEGEVGSSDFVEMVFQIEVVPVQNIRLQAGYYLPLGDAQFPCMWNVRVNDRGYYLTLLENPIGRRKCGSLVSREVFGSGEHLALGMAVRFSFHNMNKDGSLCGDMDSRCQKERIDKWEFTNQRYDMIVVDRETMVLNLSGAYPEELYTFTFAGSTKSDVERGRR